MAKRFFKSVFVAMMMVLFGVCSFAEAVVPENCVSGVLLAQNLARKEPVEGFVFAHVGDNQYEFFKLSHGATGTNKRSILENVPYNTPIATYTLYKEAAQELIKEIEWADEMHHDNCRWQYVVCEPLIIFSLRFKDTQNMRFFRILRTDTNEWKEYLTAFMTAAAASEGTLTFDWRLVYQVAFSKESASSPVHQALDYIDGFTDDKIMAKQYLGIDYFSTLLEDWYRDNPYLAPKSWSDEYQKTMRAREYFMNYGSIEGSIKDKSYLFW